MYAWVRSCHSGLPVNVFLIVARFFFYCSSRANLIVIGSCGSPSSISSDGTRARSISGRILQVIRALPDPPNIGDPTKLVGATSQTSAIMLLLTYERDHTSNSVEYPPIQDCPSTSCLSQPFEVSYTSVGNSWVNTHI